MRPLFQRVAQNDRHFEVVFDDQDSHEWSTA
ncbi:MAG: hypothetical protein QOE55_3067 [Acidobacteriaceae bacterium]|jgi:hypothetical protein|nr:hypothetical protein [Acidobacteriaceae bacterium]